MHGTQIAVQETYKYISKRKKNVVSAIIWHI